MSVISSEVTGAVTVQRRSSSGELLGHVSLDDSIFGVAVNVPLLHQVITAQLASRRAGTQSTRTRAEVKGGSAKPYRQKGTGNARQGSIRAPHYSGGGVALGPKPRSYVQRTPRKMVQQALRCALSDRASADRISVVDRWAFEVPKTKDAARFLAAAGLGGRVLLVVGRDDLLAVRSFANIPGVATVPVDQLSAYDVLAADGIVFTDATLPGESVQIDDAPVVPVVVVEPVTDVQEPGVLVAEPDALAEAPATEPDEPEDPDVSPEPEAVAVEPVAVSAEPDAVAVEPVAVSAEPDAVAVEPVAVTAEPDGAQASPPEMTEVRPADEENE